MKDEIARILLRTKAVSLRTDPPYKWVSGILAPIYTDNRVLLSYPAERKKVTRSLVAMIRKEGIKADVIAGVATSGIPWAALVADELGKPMIYVRSKSKDHGRENLMEGRLEPGQKVLVVEDLVSTGGSSISAVNAVREAGGTVDSCMAIFTYEFKKAAENFSKAGCRLITLTDFGTLIRTASRTGYLKREDVEKVLEWSEDPEGWGKDTQS
jgi:orotate phosphoribosyltransferase